MVFGYLRELVRGTTVRSHYKGERYFMVKLSWYGAEGTEHLDLVHAKYLGALFGRKQKNNTKWRKFENLWPVVVQ